MEIGSQHSSKYISCVLQKNVILIWNDMRVSNNFCIDYPFNPRPYFTYKSETSWPTNWRHGWTSRLLNSPLNHYFVSYFTTNPTQQLNRSHNVKTSCAIEITVTNKTKLCPIRKGKCIIVYVYWKSYSLH